MLAQREAEDTLFKIASLLAPRSIQDVPMLFCFVFSPPFFLFSLLRRSGPPVLRMQHHCVR